MRSIRARLGQLLPQPCVGAGLSALALLSLSASWLSWLRQPGPPSVMALLMALSLTVAIVAAYQYPIHLRHQTKLLMVSLVYYLLAVLVTPPLAATAAGLGALAGELARRRHSGAYASDIATEVGRRVLMVWLGALVAHHWGDVA